jgi:hypothetical protein
VTNEPGHNRAARHAATYPKVRSEPDAIILKLADRISNVEASLATFRDDQDVQASSFFHMYRKEYPGFREALYTESPFTEPMWARLDSLLLDSKVPKLSTYQCSQCRGSGLEVPVKDNVRPCRACGGKGTGRTLD